jgi:hypothetical protein
MKNERIVGTGREAERELVFFGKKWHGFLA